MDKFHGFKVVAENLDSIANYGIKVIGVWVGCSEPIKYLQPNPKVIKEKEETIIDASDISNLVLEIPGLPDGVIIRISFLF